MRKYLSATLLASLLLVGAGCMSSTPPAPAANPTPTPTPAANAPATNVPAVNAPAAMVPSNAGFSISMHPKGGDDEIGTTTFTPVDENHTKVTINLLHAETHGTEDAGLFSGTCKDLSAALAYDLGATVKGQGTTVLNFNLGSLKGGTKQSVRVITKPNDPGSTYWTCGDVN